MRTSSSPVEFLRSFVSLRPGSFLRSVAAITCAVDWATAVAIVLLAATAAFIQALSGFGFSLFIVPLLALLIGPKDTVVLANLLSTFSNSMQTLTLRHSANGKVAARLMIGALVGMPFGLAVLLLLDAAALQVVIAVMVIVFTVVLMRGFEIHRAGRVGDFGAGLTSGILNTSTSMSGPPVVLYLQGRGMGPLEFRATISLFFLVTSAVAVVLLALSGTSKMYLFLAWALCVPAIVVGQRLGNASFERVDPESFQKMVYAILLVSGAMAIVGAVAA